MSYEFKDYFTSEEIDDSYKNGPPNIDRPSWEANVNRSWHNYGMLDWLWERSGRPTSANLDTATVLSCIKIHLNDCLNHSHDNCDFKEKWYGAEKQHLCQICFKVIIASEAEKYCARCYRSVLNNWRPM